MNNYDEHQRLLQEVAPKWSTTEYMSPGVSTHQQDLQFVRQRNAEVRRAQFRTVESCNIS